MIWPAGLVAAVSISFMTAMPAGLADRPLPAAYIDDLDGRPARLVAPREVDVEPTRDGLAGRLLGVQRDSQHHCIARALFPDARLRLYDSQGQGFEALAEGRIDALLADAIEAYRGFLSQDAGREFDFLGNELFDRACLDVGVTQDARQDSLKQRLDDALKALHEDGSMDSLKQKYFGDSAVELE